MGVLLPQIVFDKEMERSQINKIVSSLGQHQDIRVLSDFDCTIITAAQKAELTIFPRQGGKDRVKLSRMCIV